MIARTLNLETPSFKRAESGSEALTDVYPVELNCDAVEICYDEDNEKVCAFIVEVQLSRDDRKPFAWFGYLANLFRRAECPVYVIAICPDKATADWARQSVPIGHQNILFRPYVLGPDEVPVVRQRLEGPDSYVTTFLSAIIHGEGAPGKDIVYVMEEEHEDLDPVQAAQYARNALRVLRGVAKMTLGALVRTGDKEYHHLVLGDAADEMRAEGEATALMRVVEARGMTLTEIQRDQVTKCDDLELLGQWLTRAATATKTEEIFNGEALKGSQ